MADLILSSQTENDSKFLMPTSAKDVLNPFQPKDLKIAPASGYRKRKIQPIGTPATAGGDTLIFQIPPTGMLTDCFLEIGIAVTGGGNWSANVGLNYPSRVRLLHGGQELHNYEYSAVTQVKLGRMPIEQSARVYTAAGGAAAATARRVYAPLWLPGSSFGHKEGDVPTPLPLFMSTESLQLEVDTRTVANILASGGSGGSITSVKLVYFEWIVQDEEKQRVKGQPWKAYVEDYVTLSQTSVATATLTTIDLSGLKNSLKSIGLPCVSVANADTNHNYVLNSNFDSSELLADGQRLYFSEYASETILEELIVNKSKTGADAVLGKAQEIAFNKFFSQDIYSGSFHSNICKKLEFAFTHSVGANIYIKPVAVRNAYIVFSENSFKRIL
jgi:hypothetical protein